jgi:hypothetical protein
MYACITCHVSCPSSFYQLGSHILACTCIWTSMVLHLSWDMSRVFVSLSQASSNDSGSIDVYVGNHPCMHDVFIWCAKLHLNHAFHANFRELTHTMHVRSLALNNVDRVDTCKRARATTHVQTHTHTHTHIDTMPVQVLTSNTNMGYLPYGSTAPMILPNARVQQGNIRHVCMHVCIGACTLVGILTHD